MIPAVDDELNFVRAGAALRARRPVQAAAAQAHAAIDLTPPPPQPPAAEVQLAAAARPEQHRRAAPDPRIPAPVGFLGGVLFTMIVVVLASSNLSQKQSVPATSEGSVTARSTASTQQQASTNDETNGYMPVGWTYVRAGAPITITDAEGRTLGILPKDARAFVSWRATTPTGDLRPVVAEDGSFWGYAHLGPMELSRTPMHPDFRGALAVIRRLQAPRGGYRSVPGRAVLTGGQQKDNASGTVRVRRTEARLNRRPAHPRTGRTNPRLRAKARQ